MYERDTTLSEDIEALKVSVIELIEPIVPLFEKICKLLGRKPKR